MKELLNFRQERRLLLPEKSVAVFPHKAVAHRLSPRLQDTGLQRQEIRIVIRGRLDHWLLICTLLASRSLHSTARRIAYFLMYKFTNQDGVKSQEAANFQRYPDLMRHRAIKHPSIMVMARGVESFNLLLALTSQSPSYAFSPSSSFFTFRLLTFSFPISIQPCISLPS